MLVVAVNGELGEGTVTRDWEKVYTAIETVAGLGSTELRNVQGRDAYAFIMKTGKIPYRTFICQTTDVVP